MRTVAATPEEPDVAGIAESHCVLATMPDAIAAGFSARVLLDLTVPVSREPGATAHAEMAAAGAEPVPPTAV